ncbi:MAG: hypothetical protein R3F05_16135 [Planctomycetota bacterium]
MTRRDEAAARYEQALLHVRVLHGSIRSLAGELLGVRAEDVADPGLRTEHVRLAAVLAECGEASGAARRRIVRDVESLAARLRLQADFRPPGLALEA